MVIVVDGNGMHTGLDVICETMRIPRTYSRTHAHVCTAWHAYAEVGKIAVVSSGFGVLPGPKRTGYCGSKYATHGFFESLRLEALALKRNLEITMIWLVRGV